MMKRVFLLLLLLGLPALAQDMPALARNGKTMWRRAQGGLSPQAAWRSSEVTEVPDPALELGVAIIAAPAWKDVGAAGDATIAYQLRSPSQDADFIVRVGASSARSLRGVWTSLRYAVIIELGGSIVKDDPLKLAGAPARQLIYDTYSSRGVERHLEIDLLAAKKHIIISYDAPKAVFNNHLGEVQKMVATLRLVAEGGK